MATPCVQPSAGRSIRNYSSHIGNLNEAFWRFRGVLIEPTFKFLNSSFKVSHLTKLHGSDITRKMIVFNVFFAVSPLHGENALYEELWEASNTSDSPEERLPHVTFLDKTCQRPFVSCVHVLPPGPLPFVLALNALSSDLLSLHLLRSFLAPLSLHPSSSSCIPRLPSSSFSLRLSPF